MTQLGMFEGAASRAERGPTLAEARRDLMERGRWEGVRCPCCDGMAKVYACRINAAAARALILLARATQPGDYAHFLELMKRAGVYSGHYAELARWGLIERAPDRAKDGNPSTGLYRVTDLGRRFVHGEATVPARAITYNDELLRLEGEPVSIRDVLGDRFDYGDLMGARPAPGLEAA